MKVSIGVIKRFLVGKAWNSSEKQGKLNLATKQTKLCSFSTNVYVIAFSFTYVKFIVLK